MKKLLYLTILVLCGFFANAQSHQVNENYLGSSKANNVARNGLRADSTFGLPLTDTLFHPWRPGYQTFTHGHVYVWNGFVWSKITDSVGGSGAAGVTSFNSRVGAVVPDSSDYANFYAGKSSGITINGVFVQLGGTRTLQLASADYANQGVSVNNVLHGNPAGNPSWSKVNLPNDVAGILTVPLGGSGTSTPSLVNGVKTIVTGSWPAQAINVDTATFPKPFNIGSGMRLVAGGQSNQIKSILFTGAGQTSDSISNPGTITVNIPGSSGGAQSGFMAARDTIFQTSHGFTVGKVVAFNGAAWVLADTTSNFPLGLVSIVIDANNFEVTHAGKMRWTAHGKITGVPYYATSSGNITNIPPNTTIPVVWFIDANTAIVKMERGLAGIAGGGPSGGSALSGQVMSIPYFNTSTSLGSSNLLNDTIRSRISANNLNYFQYALSSDPTFSLNDTLRAIIDTRKGSIKVGNNLNGNYYNKDSLPYYSYDFGYQNYIVSGTYFNSIEGSQDSIWAWHSHIIGAQNSAGRRSSPGSTTAEFVIGIANTVTAPGYGFVFGQGNTVTTQGTALGFANTVGASNAIALGTSGSLAGQYSSALGFSDTTTSTATYSIVWGTQSLAAGIASTAGGFGVKAKQNYQTVIGKWNDTTITNAAFVIGWGTNNNNRFNVLDVDTLGGIFYKPGTTANRPATPRVGNFRYNTDSSGFEYYNGAWHTFAVNLSPSVTIYNGDGTLNSARVITTGGNSLTLTTTTSDIAGQTVPTNFMSQSSEASSVGNITNGSFRINQTGANTGTTEAFMGYTKLSHGVGSVVNAVGVEGVIELAGAGTLASGRAGKFGIITSSTGTVTEGTAIYSGGVQVGGTNTVTNAYGLYIDANAAGSGAITNDYGIWQQSSTSKNVLNGSLLLPNASLLSPDTTNYKLAVVDASGKIFKSNWVNAISGNISLNVEQAHTSGATVTVTNGVSILYVDPASTLASLTVTLPAAAHNSKLIWIHFGGTLTSGTVVTSLSIVGNGGQTIVQLAAPTTASAGNDIVYRLRESTSQWYRIN